MEVEWVEVHGKTVDIAVDVALEELGFPTGHWPTSKLLTRESAGRSVLARRTPLFGSNRSQPRRSGAGGPGNLATASPVTAVRTASRARIDRINGLARVSSGLLLTSGRNRTSHRPKIRRRSS